MRRREMAGALLVAFALSSRPTAAEPPAIDADVAAYNYVLGTQTFGITYQFTSKNSLVETAEAIRRLGSNAIKFFAGRGAAGQYRMTLPPAIASLTALVRDEPSFRAVLDMPFAHYVLWAYTFADDDWRHGLSAERRDAVYREFNEFCAYLLTAYRGSGKTFYLGHWEGDWTLLGHTDRTKDPPEEAVRGMIEWLNIRQKALDDAVRAHGQNGVRVYHYTEVNLVAKALEGRGVTVTTHVLPHVDVDFVSYSAYDTLDFADGTRTEALTKALDFIAAKMRPKPAIAGRRVFIGEYGFPLELMQTPARQDAATRAVARAGLAWGCPFVLYWELYCNELAKDGKHRGFWLIDDKGVEQPVYATHRDFLARGAAFVTEWKKARGRVPTADEFRAAASEWLKDEKPAMPAEPVRAGR
jgi:hypothetical protein